MQPEHLKLGGGVTASTVHPAVLAAMLLLALLIFLLPRKHVIVCVLFGAFMIPMGQQFVIAGVHVQVFRVVLLAALIRALISKGKCFPDGMRTLDKVFFAWTFFHVLAFLALFSFQSAAFVSQFAFVWDCLGGFLVARYFIQDEEDIDRVLRTLAYIAAVLAVCVLNEHFRMQNVFGILGGVPVVPELRDGLVRAQAAFAHPLLAGTFGATIVPLFLLLWQRGKSKALALVGLISATIIAVCASSSTPFIAYAAGIGAVCLWPFRKNMRMFRWGIVFALIGLQIVMKAPVWFLIAHISLFGGSSSDHRAYLVDAFVRHFSDWWLIGTNDTGSWGWDMWDTSNQYIAEGENGGLIVFICFIAMFSISFGSLGKARKAIEGDRAKEWSLWLLGAALFATLVGYFGVSYFDQIRMLWYLLLVVISTATAPILAAKEKTEPQVAEATPTPARPIRRDPWIPAPANKTLLGHPRNAFKPRRS